jgi:hypothetical protein
MSSAPSQKAPHRAPCHDGLARKRDSLIGHRRTRRTATPLKHARQQAVCRCQRHRDGPPGRASNATASDWTAGDSKTAGGKPWRFLCGKAQAGDGELSSPPYGETTAQIPHRKRPPLITAQIPHSRTIPHKFFYPKMPRDANKPLTYDGN